jgi:hypothetical protein
MLKIKYFICLALCLFSSNVLGTWDGFGGMGGLGGVGHPGVGPVGMSG